MGIFNHFNNRKNSEKSLDIEQLIDVTLKGPKSSSSKNDVYIPQTSRTLEVKIPNEIGVGQRLQLIGCGLTSPNGQVGDLYLKVRSIDYKDITITKNIKKTDIEDGRIALQLPHLNKTIDVTIPNQLINHDNFTLRLEGLGFSQTNTVPGDLFLCVTIDRNTENFSNSTEYISPAYQELFSLIGLSEIKHDVTNMINLVKMQTKRTQQGLNSIPVSMHCVFTGNPGTGKTTIARILADIYRNMGILSKGQLIEVDRSELVSQYIGETAIKTQEKINQALGGILFIDEAYTLVKEGRDHGQESIDTLLKAMEDHRDDFIVIVAGYDDLMQNFINSNPGLKSRFNKFFHFPDYNSAELIQIFNKYCDQYGYYLTDGAEKVMKMVIERMEATKSDNFANAREIRNLFEQVITNQATRLAETASNDISLLTEEDFFVIHK